MTKLPNPKTEVDYWDEMNKTMFPWFKKGRMKRLLRKRFLNKQIRSIDKSQEK